MRNLNRLIVCLVLISLVASAFAQYPISCTNSSSCCPSTATGVCGGTSRGACVSSSLIMSEFATCHSSYIPWSSICQCKAKFFGSDCSKCAPGWTGDNCESAFVAPRYDFYDLSIDDQNSWISAVVNMQNYFDPNFQPPGESSASYSVYQTFVLLHQYSMFGYNFAHKGPGFPTWHRYLLWLWEMKLHDFGFPLRLGSPFWNWSQESNRMWLFNGTFGNMDGVVTTGPFANWTTVGTGIPGQLLYRNQGFANTTLPTSEYISEVLNLSPYDAPPWNENSTTGFRNHLEGFVPQRQMHNLVHFYVGGMMANISISANDPVFWLHHTFVDYLLERWYIKFGFSDFPLSGAPVGHNRGECIVPLYPLMSHQNWLGFSRKFGYFYVASKPSNGTLPSLQYADDSIRKPYLDIMKNGIEKFPVGQLPPNVIIVGGAITGLYSGYLLKQAGYKVTILEASSRIGGRIDTRQCDFSTPPGGRDSFYPEAGAMRFPCSHWAVFMFAQLFNITSTSFRNSNPEGLVSISCIDFVFPRKALDPTSDVYNATLPQKIYQCFNVTNPQEQIPSGLLVDNAFSLLVAMIAEDVSNWDMVLDILDTYTLRDFFISYVGYSVEAVDMIGTMESISFLMAVNSIEFFRDYIGQWWNDGITYPENADNGLPVQGLYEFKTGSSALPYALYKDMQDDIRFGCKVVGVSYTDDQVTLTASVHGETSLQTYTGDFAIFGVQDSILRTFNWEPPLPERKVAAQQFAYFIPAVKIISQLRNSYAIETPSPSVPPQYLATGIKNGTGGSSLTDTIFGSLYYPTHPTENRTQIVFYNLGQDAELSSALTRNDLNRKVVNLLMKLHGGRISSDFEFLTLKSWADTPEEEGAVHLLLKNQYKLRMISAEPYKRMHFGSDDKSDYHGWAQGALLSAIRCVLEIDEVARNQSFPPPSFFAEFDGTTIPVNEHVNITCGHQVQQVSVSFGQNYTYFVDSGSNELVGTVLKGNVTITVGSQTSTLVPGKQFMIPMLSHASFYGYDDAFMNYAQDTSIEGRCHHQSPVINVQYRSAIPMTLNVRGNIPDTLAGHANNASFAEVFNASDVGAGFFIGSLSTSADLSGPSIITNNLAYNLPSVLSNSSTFLKLEYGINYHSYSGLVFPKDASVVSYSLEYLPPPDDIFRPATLSSIYNSINHYSVQESSCFVGMAKFDSLNCVQMTTPSFETTQISFRSSLLNNVTVGITGCISPTTVNTEGKSLVFPPSVESVVFGLIQSQESSNEYFDDIDSATSICSITADNIPYSIQLDVYIVAKFSNGSDASQSPPPSPPPPPPSPSPYYEYRYQESMGESDSDSPSSILAIFAGFAVILLIIAILVILALIVLIKKKRDGYEVVAAGDD